MEKENSEKNKYFRINELYDKLYKYLDDCIKAMPTVRENLNEIIDLNLEKELKETIKVLYEKNLDFILNQGLVEFIYYHQDSHDNYEDRIKETVKDITMLNDMPHLYTYISNYINTIEKHLIIANVFSDVNEKTLKKAPMELVNNIICFNKWCTEFRKKYSPNDFVFVERLIKMLCIYSYINNICYDDLVSIIDLNDILEYLELNNIKNGLIKDNLHYEIDNDFSVAIQCLTEFLNKCVKEKQLKKIL